MRHIFLGISGTLFAWSVIAFFTDSWELKDFIVAVFLGFVVGYAIKKQKEKDEDQSY